MDWTNGELYVGMVKGAAMADDDKYYNWLKEIGEKHEWKLHRRKYHADDHTVGQLYVELYRKYMDENMLEPTKEQFNFIMLHPAQTSLQWKSPYHQSRWNWCDALFMSPPVWAKLYNITGEEKYLDFMVAEYKATTNFLFDKEESLYYRDESYMGKLDNGTKIFWSRGNGWVFAGLTNIMNELSPQSKEYKYFLKIYKKMAKKLFEIQTPEGHWSMSLLGQEFYPTPETSGSSFYTYGLAWGINKRILDKATYAPAVKKGWNAMVSHVTKEGMLGYVQPIGAAPGKAWADKTEVYGTGAFLSAGSEVYKLYGGE
jgi:unsaturated rhamnogalacturonyl hydrolase